MLLMDYALTIAVQPAGAVRFGLRSVVMEATRTSPAAVPAGAGSDAVVTAVPELAVLELTTVMPPVAGGGADPTVMVAVAEDEPVALVAVSLAV